MADVRDIMVEGDAETPGILDIFPRHQRPIYIPNRRVIRFHTGARAFTFSAEKPGRLRGPQFHFGWCDEMGAWEEAGRGRAQKTWDMFQFGLRKGENPQCVITTTPKPIKLIRDLLKDASTIVTRGNTWANQANLADSFIKEMVRIYGGTRIGRQELEAEVLDDVEGALWTLGLIEAHRVKLAPENMARVLVGVDPSVAGKDMTADKTRKRDDCGIVVSGRVGPRKPFAPRFVLGDYSLNAGPDVWAVEVVRAYWMHEADAVVAEVNNGGELVRMAIHAVDPRVNVIIRTATRDKATRSEPVAMAYVRGEVSHVGAMPALEDEMTTWVPDGSSQSPNRVDALVWSIIEDMEPSKAGGVYV